MSDTITATIYTADTPNVNGVIYPKAELERAVKEYNSRKAKFATLESYPPAGLDNSNVDLAAIAGVVKLSIDGDKVIANIELMDTPKGKQCKKESKDKLSVLPTCMGALGSNQTVSDMSICNIVITPVDDPRNPDVDIKFEGHFTISDGRTN